MRIDRNAAAVVGNRQEAVGVKLDLDEGGMAGHRLVHRIVDDLGEEMVQRLLVGAADIHARPPAHRLQPFQYLDVGCTIALAAVLGRHGSLGCGLHERIGWAHSSAGRRFGMLAESGEKIVAVVHDAASRIESRLIMPRFDGEGTEVLVPFRRRKVQIGAFPKGFDNHAGGLRQFEEGGGRGDARSRRSGTARRRDRRRSRMRWLSLTAHHKRPIAAGTVAFAHIGKPESGVARIKNVLAMARRAHPGGEKHAQVQVAAGDIFGGRPSDAILPHTRVKIPAIACVVRHAPAACHIVGLLTCRALQNGISGERGEAICGSDSGKIGSA